MQRTTSQRKEQKIKKKMKETHQGWISQSVLLGRGRDRVPRDRDYEWNGVCMAKAGQSGWREMGWLAKWRAYSTLRAFQRDGPTSWLDVEEARRGHRRAIRVSERDVGIRKGERARAMFD